MDNNFDNTPKDGNAPVQLSKESGNEGARADSNKDQSANQPDAGAQYTDPNAGRQYTDPNAGQQPYGSQQYQYGNQNDQNQQNAYNYNQQQYYSQQNQSNGYSYGQQSGYNQQNNYSQQSGYNYQDNYSYNTGNGNNYNQMYDPGMDTSPMSMGDWVLTILALMIPCAGIILYFVWAFSKTTNVNRRNFCRAQLIITGVVLVIYLIFIALFGSMIFSSGFYY